MIKKINKARKTRKVRKTNKARKGQRLDKGESLYTPELAERAREIIIEAQLIKADGSLHYTKLGKILGIPSRTMSHWRNATSKYYKPKFVKVLADAREELLEGLQSGQITQAMIQRSLPYTRIRKTKERMVKGPKMPAMSGMDLKGLRLIAIKLGIPIDKKMTRGILRVKITEEVVNQTKEVMVTTRQEEERMHGDPTSAKLVKQYIGPKDKRWIPQQKLEVEGRSLADIAAIMSGKKVG